MTIAPLQVLDPTEPPYAESNQIAPRLSTLNGKVVGLYANSKLNAVELLDLCEKELLNRFDLAGVVRGSYNTGRVMAPEEWIDVEKCDAIILTHGD
jgi:hypothetical protein